MSSLIQQLLVDLLIILTAGFVSGAICKRIRLPMVVGYLIVGALIGSGMLGLLSSPQTENSSKSPDSKPTATLLLSNEKSAARGTPPKEDSAILEGVSVSSSVSSDGMSSQQHVTIETQHVEHRILEQLAHLGANLLLFAIGIQFSPSELSRIWRFFLVGGLIQMLGVIVPIGLFFWLIGGDWRVGLVLGSAISLSSTVLVFKSLEDMGHATSPHGIRAVAILLFQDVAVVPLLVLVGLLTALASGAAGTTNPLSTIGMLGINSILFVSFVVVVRFLFCRFGVPLLGGLRSVELMVLFTMILLIGVSSVAGFLSLPGALGAMAAGVILSETRLTHQITAITVPMRETFSAIFFVSLGALFDPSILFTTPISTVGALLACIALKTLAAGLAFRVLGLSWPAAFGMGLGLSQLGELSFVLLSQGVASGLFDYETYQRVLFVALTTIIMTPLFLKIALRVTPEQREKHDLEESESVMYPEDAQQRALVIGLGPIGSRIVTFLELSGFDVGLIDMNPVNLHPYAQQGFRTVSGDASDDEVLRIIDLKHSNLVVVSVPDDLIALEIIETIRFLNQDCLILARCRYSINIRQFERLGVNMVICEEAETGAAVVQSLQKIL